MKKLLQEFKEFALRGNVMDLAVGVIIGAAFQAIINSLVNDVISPLIGLFANTDLTYLSVMVGDVEIRYGAFLTAVINFIIMAVIIFLMVKGMNALAGLGKKKEPEKPAVKMCPYCRSKVAAEATRCPYCTSMLEVKKEDKKRRSREQQTGECSGRSRVAILLFTVPSSESVRRLHPYNRSASRSARRWELADSPDPPDCRSGREAPVRYKQFRHGTGG